MQVFRKDQSVPDLEGSAMHVQGKNFGKVQWLASPSANEWTEAYSYRGAGHTTAIMDMTASIIPPYSHSHSHSHCPKSKEIIKSVER